MRAVIVIDEKGVLWYVSAESSQDLLAQLTPLVNLKSVDTLWCYNSRWL